MSAQLVKPPGCMELTKSCVTYLPFMCNDLKIPKVRYLLWEISVLFWQGKQEGL